MKCIVQNKFWDIAEDYNKEKLLYFLIDRPNLIDSHDGYTWFNNKEQYHREYDLPAYICNNGIMWCKNNKFNRINNKPAIIEGKGTREYWLDSKYIKTEYLK